MRCALYVRVSTEEQSLDNQLAQLREYASRQGWQIVREHTDLGLSGKNGDRPAFKQMLRDASQRRFDVLLFWSLDRLTREGTMATLSYLTQLTACGIRWHSLQEQYLSSLGPFGDAVVAILAAIAQQERLRISERVKAGLARTRAKGTIVGRPRLAVDVAAARDRIAAGESLRSVARGLGCSAGLLCKRLGATATTTL